METLEQLGFNATVVLFFVAGVIGGLARVARRHGWNGFTTPKLIVDSIFSALGGVLYPYAVPQFVMSNIPPVVIACGIAFITYWLNDLFIKKLKTWFGYTDSNGISGSNYPPVPPPPSSPPPPPNPATLPPDPGMIPDANEGGPRP